jgi:hypothetical protein
MRNANLAVAIGMTFAVLGCWLAGWEVDDREAVPIVFSTFATGFTALWLLERRRPTEPLEKPVRRSR